MSAAVLSIGTELTRGEIQNTNATWLAEELTRIGLDVTHAEVVPDDRALIQSSLAKLGSTHDVIVSTGGLGPTTDDITNECVASTLGVPLERDEASLQVITARMSRFGRVVAPSNAKQADFPRGSVILANPHGTAPGFAVTIGRARAFFMPGVPSEMKPMFTTHVAPVMEGMVRGGMHQIRLRTFGMAESTVNDRLAGIEEAHGVVIGYRAHFPEIEVKVLARAASQDVARETALRAAGEVRKKLGDAVYGEGETALPEVVLRALRERGMSFATAESCTGGLVASLFTDTPGSSDVFRGAVVAYDNAVKTGVLGVPAAVLARAGAVSPEVARAMAEGARRALGADVALSLTGIAGPGGGTETKPVGLVHFAVATPEGTVDRNLVFPGNRPQVRLVAAYAGLSLVHRVALRGLSAA